MNEIFKELEEHHDVLGNFAVSLQQLYKWLQKDIEEVDIRHPTSFHDSKAYNRDRARLFCLYTDIQIDIQKVSFMWRSAVGGLKTGEVVRKSQRAICQPQPIFNVDFKLIMC